MHCRRWRRSRTLGWYSRVSEVGTKRLIHGLVKQMQFCVSFIAPWWWNGSFQRPQSFQFLNRSVPILTCGHESWVTTERIVKRLNGREGIFAKSSRCDTSWQRAQVWNRWSPGCQDTSPNREISSILVRPCVQNVSGKIGEVSPSVYGLHPSGESGPEVVQGPRDVTTSLALLGPVLVWSEQNNRRLLLTVTYFPPRLSSKENRVWKWMNDWVSEWMSEWVSVQANIETFYLWHCL